HLPVYANRVRGPTPQRPSARAAANAATSPPSAVMAPRPVTATCRTVASVRLPALRLDEVDQGPHRGERALADLLVGNRHPESILDQHHHPEAIHPAHP